LGGDIVQLDLTVLEEITLLYVEDDKSIREIYGERLKKLVKQIYIGKDGEEGLSLFKSWRPDIVLTDIQMPNMSGLDMIKAIREISEDTPIIITTAFSESDFFQKAISLHVDGYLIKPIDKGELFFELQKLSKQTILKREERKNRELLQLMIDFQESMNLILQESSVVFANRSFLKKFEVGSIEEFNSRENSFLKELFAFNKRGVEETVIVIDEDRNIVPVADIEVKKPQAFLLRAKYVKDMDYHIVNLTEITAFIEERNKLQQLAFFDSLTSVYNRSRFNQFLDSEIERAFRYGSNFSLLLLDIDHFKMINDNYGHPVGDEALIELSRLIKSHIRKSDIFARWGGEEFAIIFSNTTIHTAEIATENLRERIQESIFTTEQINFTCSFGLTEYRDGDSRETIFKRCDDLLYKAKKSGRNRVILQ
jgi:diguanylate cyclase (GGDEF)-like protein